MEQVCWHLIQLQDKMIITPHMYNLADFNRKRSFFRVKELKVGFGFCLIG